MSFPQNPAESLVCVTTARNLLEMVAELEAAGLGRGPIVHGIELALTTLRKHGDKMPARQVLAALGSGQDVEASA